LTSETLRPPMRRDQAVPVKLEPVAATGATPRCRSPRATFLCFGLRCSTAADALVLWFHQPHRLRESRALAALRREWNCSRSGERQAEASKHYEVSVKGDSLQATDAKRRQAELMLKPPELPLHRDAATVKLTPPLRLTRDERVATCALNPLALGLRLARGAAPLGGVSLEVCARERPVAVLALGRVVVARLRALVEGVRQQTPFQKPKRVDQRRLYRRFAGALELSPGTGL
jgi:hypothetical protein